jgi:hypothetical protein
MNPQKSFFGKALQFSSPSNDESRKGERYKNESKVKPTPVC